MSLIKEIELELAEKTHIDLGVNKRNELVRLIYEISRRDGKSPGRVLEQIRIDSLAEEGKGDFFHRLKRRLMYVRYPSFVSGKQPHLIPLKIDEDQLDHPAWNFEISPRAIFVEKDTRDSEWTEKFLLNFPGAEIKEISAFKKGAESLTAAGSVGRYNQRCDNIFLIRSKDAFIKICPCTKGYKRCGYWILNIGFGCPIDCAFCFLQLYSNAPGLILPVNMEDYYPRIEQFDRKREKRTRIGTGEFTDSLALDKYTGYVSMLIPFFRKAKNLILELKTKTADVNSVLREEPHENIVISWSMNTRDIASRYEKGAASVDERIAAAVSTAERGYKIGFHFDPVVYFRGWEDQYKALVEEIFSKDALRENTAWVSLGTLRYTPGLKQAAEQRFSDTFMYYTGEFFADTDGKLRYPRELRIDIYDKMITWIRKFDASCWIYLCMEPEEVWRRTPLKEDDYNA